MTYHSYPFLQHMYNHLRPVQSSLPAFSDRKIHCKFPFLCLPNRKTACCFSLSPIIQKDTYQTFLHFQECSYISIRAKFCNYKTHYWRVFGIPNNQKERKITAMSSKYLTLKEFCELTRISASTAYRMIRNGMLPATKLNGGRYWKIPADFVPTYNPDSGRIER